MFKTMTGSIKNIPMPSEIELKKVSSFMFCRWLSGCKYTIQTANLFNNFSKIPFYCQFKMVKVKFGGKISYIPYPKQLKDISDKKIEIIEFMLKLNRDRAVDYLKFISKEEFKMLENEFNLMKTR